MNLITIIFRRWFAFTAIALVLMVSVGFSQTTPDTLVVPANKYSRVKIYTGKDGLMQLARLGIPVDHGEIKKDVFFISDFSKDEIELIKSNGFKYEILIDDVVEHYREQNKVTPDTEKKEKPPDEKSKTQKSKKKVFSGACSAVTDYPVPANFSLGSMGGYFTLSEMEAALDTMRSKFPNLITAKQQIGVNTSIEGRPVWWVKISDNPDSNEAEPEVLYTALTHVREPVGLSQMIFYMYYLLENYGTDDEVTYLVDNTEMYFIPCVNPDGYVYNETTDPGGGGMWRKNRRNNGDGTFGVDLNRNYGFNWGYDNTGSSPNTSSDTYRGTAPFSEPETQIVKEFCEEHEFKITLNYHAYGNMLIYPWGYALSIYTPDSAVFVEYATLMTDDNDYLFGTGDQTVGYVTNGDADDWMYGEQITKSKILSMTPEAGPGNFGFWPPSSAITGICKENMWQNLATAHLAVRYALAEDLSQAIISQQTGYFNFSIKRLGLDSPAVFTVAITPLGTGIDSIGSPKTFTGMGLLEQRLDSVFYTLDTNLQSGQTFRFVLSVDNGLYIERDTITKVFGQLTAVFNDNANTISNWTTASWGISNTVFYSASGSIADSPGGNYQNNSTTSITLTNPIDLSGAMRATLSFWTRWEIEAGYDYVQVLASADTGTTWTPLCGIYTKTGTSDQDPGNPVYDGFQTSWVQEEMNIDDFAGKSLLLKYQLVSDWFTTEDGYYFDDLTVKIQPNTLALTVSSIDATCSNSDGIAIANVNGGVPPYTYQWNDPALQTTDTAAGLPVGVYNVTVKDALGYSLTGQVSINNTGAAALSVNAADVSCFGENDGSVTLTTSGGTLPFTYSWSNGDTTKNISGLDTGTYTVTVTDSNGCVSTANATITQPDSIVLLAIVTDDSSSGTGAIDLTVTGGNQPYTFSWSNGSNTEDIDSLTAGTYVIVITDYLGCSLTDSFSVANVSGIAYQYSLLVNQIIVYPNPNTGHFIIEIPEGFKDGSLLSVQNILGQIVYNEHLPANRHLSMIDMSGQAQGIYLITVKNRDGFVKTVKIVII